PLYIKQACKDDPLFENSKVIYSLYGDKFEGALNKRLSDKAVWDGVEADDLSVIKSPTHNNLSKLAVNWADAIVKVDPNIDADVLKHIKKSGKPMLTHTEDNYMDAYSEFYDEVLEMEEALVND
ncbi:MAG TPA: glycogen/starch synthase, partial [Bacteroidia bacterium]|nr:glycogen/starch synthase [Bacteroidia bacterium]